MAGPWPGKSCQFLIGNTGYAFEYTSLDESCEPIDVTVFTSGGYKENIAGLLSRKLQFRGPLRTGGAMAFTSGSTYAVIFEVTSGVQFTTTIRIDSIRVVGDTKDAVRVEFSGQSNGSFTAGVS